MQDTFLFKQNNIVCCYGKTFNSDLKWFVLLKHEKEKMKIKCSCFNEKLSKYVFVIVAVI